MMYSMDKSTIIKPTAFMLKLATLFISSPVKQFISQEIIDSTKDYLLQSPKEFPKINEVLSEYDEIIQYAVNDIIDTRTNNIEQFLIYTKTEEIVNLLINNNTSRLSLYSPSQQHDIKSATRKYINSTKEWAVTHEPLLISCFEDIYDDLKEIHHRIDGFQKYLDTELSTTILPSTAQKNPNNLSKLDCFLNEGDYFYNHLSTDSSTNINNLFLCDNYEIVKLDFSCSSLKDYHSSKPQMSYQLSDFDKIIESQKILLITGLYGTGKTTLMKKLHYEYKQLNHNVYFFRAKDINNFIEAFPPLPNAVNYEKSTHRLLNESFLSLRKSDGRVYIFIDELEDLNIAYKENIRLNNFLDWLCQFIFTNKDYYFILGSRKYALIGQNAEKHIADQLFYSYFDANLGNEINIILTNTFTTASINTWIDCFATLKNSYVRHTIIRNSYKKISTALQTPIFLFAFMQRYLNDNNNQTLSGYYSFYSTFIDNTIKGKYLVPFAPITLKRLPSDEEYRQILRKIAFFILQGSPVYISSEIYRSYIEEDHPLLAEKLSNVKYNINQGKLKKLLGAEEYITANVVNCYFFRADSNKVYFTDTNILFALASEFIFYSLERIVQNNDCIFHVNQLMEIEMIHLYPHLVDYIVYLAKHSNASEYIKNYAHSFVVNDSIRYCCLDLSSSNTYIYEKILLLYILFLKTNKESYNYCPLNQVFENLSLYIQLHKSTRLRIHSSNNVYSVERYFMNIDLHHLTVYRFNFSDYNFMGSRITDECKFSQCYFLQTNFQKVVMNDVKFSLCHFKNIDKFSVTKSQSSRNQKQIIFDRCSVQNCSFTAEDVLFRNCKIENLTLTLSGDRAAIFEKCSISKLTISLLKKKHASKLEFISCNFESDPAIPTYLIAKYTNCF